MTSVKFFADEKGLFGFEISGHCSQNGDDEIGKIVCSAVSSAAYMAANTIIEIIGDECEANIDDAVMCIKVKNATEKTQAILNGLKLHLTELSKDYGNNIKIHGGVDHVKD